MQNFVHPGDVLAFTAPAGGIASGEGHLFGALFGIAATSAPEGQKVSVQVEGVFTLPKATGGLSEGQAIYWDTAAKHCTATATGNSLIGHAAAAAAADSATATVRLAG